MASNTNNNEARKNLKNRAKTEFSKSHVTESGKPEIRILQMKVEHRDEKNRVQRLSVGTNTNTPVKIVMFVGATGSGKTTMINAMVNFIYGIDFDDNFRLTIPDPNITRNKSSKGSSVMDFITAYIFYYLPGMPFNYSFILIDTPGFGDTKGIERDREMMNQLKCFLSKDYIADQVDGIAFIAQANTNRLTHTQKYLFDGLLSMFGKDVAKNIKIIATHNDGGKNPELFNVLVGAKVTYSEKYVLNNGALYTNNDASDVFIKHHWDNSHAIFRTFFLSLGKNLPVSLKLTKEVLEERSKLQIHVISLQKNIRVGLAKLSSLNVEWDIMKEIKDGTESIEVEVLKIKKIKLTEGEHVTNCVKCHFTCHYPCFIPADENKDECWAMTNNYCRNCPGKCFWNMHQNIPWRYEETWISEKKSLNSVRERYIQGLKNIDQQEKVIYKMEKEIKDLEEVLVKLIRTCKNHVKKLEDIALKPNPLSTKEYIDLMIESEKIEKSKNFEKRVSLLEKLKEEATIVQGVINDSDKISGQSWMEYFQKLMKY